MAGFAGGRGLGGAVGRQPDLRGAEQARTPAAQQPPGPESEFHLHLYGDFDALNPRVYNTIVDAYDFGKPRRGTTRTVIHHHPPR